MKKTLFILCLALLIPAALASAASVSIGDASGSKGGTFKVPINVAGASKIGSMDIVVEYDPSVLKVVSAEKGTLTTNALFETNTATSGKVVIVLADSAGFSGDGSVAAVNFEIIGEPGSSSALTLTTVEATNAETVLDVQLTKTNGIFTVTAASIASSAGIYVVALIILILVAVVAMRIRKK